MGNESSKNDDFSKNPNFNIHQHSQAMANLQANYTNTNYQFGQGQVYHNTQVIDTEFRTVHRTASIYKPSITIVPRLIVSITSQIPLKYN